VLHARPERLGQIAGAEAAGRVAALRACVHHVLRASLAKRPILSDWRALLDYLTAGMAARSTEQFRVLHLDARNGLIGDEVMGEGTVDEAPIYVREVIHRAMDLGSTALILVHNHPSGDATASGADVAVTRAVMHAATPLGIAVHDHLIISRNGHVSMRAQGLI